MIAGIVGMLVAFLIVVLVILFGKRKLDLSSFFLIGQIHIFWCEYFRTQFYLVLLFGCKSSSQFLA